MIKVKVSENDSAKCLRFVFVFEMSSPAMRE